MGTLIEARKFFLSFIFSTYLCWLLLNLSLPQNLANKHIIINTAIWGKQNIKPLNSSIRKSLIQITEFDQFPEQSYLF